MVPAPAGRAHAAVLVAGIGALVTLTGLWLATAHPLAWLVGVATTGIVVVTVILHWPKQGAA